MKSCDELKTSSLEKELETFPFPRVVRIEPAAKCNLACSHCPTGTVDMVRGLMKNDVFEKTLGEIVENINFIKVVVFYHGGEPLLNKNFYSMVSAVRELSDELKIKTVTNGMSLNENNISKLLKCGLNEVEISLDGLSPSESEEVRIKSNSKRIIQNVKQLIAERDKSNSNLQINIVTTQFLRSKNDLEDPKNLNPDAPKWLIDEFCDSVTYKSFIAMRWPHMNVGEEYELLWADGEDKSYCDLPINTITVRSNGDIVPCCFDLTSQLVMGNILEDNLLSIFNGEKYRQLRSSINEKKYNSLCQNCNVVRPHVYLLKPHLTA